MMGLHPLPDDCTRACEWVSLRLDSQLSEFEGLLLDAHLSRCVDCSAFADSVTSVTEVLRTSLPERPTFAFELPRRSDGRARALRAVSTAAAVAVVGLSGLVSLHLSTSRAPGATVRSPNEVIGLKERLLEQLDGTGRTLRPQIRPSLVEQATFGSDRVAGKHVSAVTNRLPR
jgi:predicted anti-sigma-YlaC factor YlaD